jgi:DNA-directed RNA polymerase specialized sigma24 family protein
MSDDHEEVIQTVFLKTLEGMRAGRRPPRRTEPYLLAIARNVTWDLLRSRKRSVFVNGVAEDALDDRGVDPSQEAALWALQAYTASLPPQLAIVFSLRFGRGYSQAHTCREMAISRQCLRTLEERLREGARQAAGALVSPPRRKTADTRRSRK